MFREYLEDLLRAVRRAELNGTPLHNATQTIHRPKDEKIERLADRLLENIEAESQYLSVH